jgi:hypothetical protein
MPHPLRRTASTRIRLHFLTFCGFDLSGGRGRGTCGQARGDLDPSSRYPITRVYFLTDESIIWPYRGELRIARHPLRPRTFVRKRSCTWWGSGRRKAALRVFLTPTLSATTLLSQRSTDSSPKQNSADDVAAAIDQVITLLRGVLEALKAPSTTRRR